MRIVDGFRGGEILQREADRLEHGHLVVAGAARVRAAREVPQFRGDLRLGDRPALQRLDHVAALGQRGGAVVDDDQVGPLHRRVVGLPHVRLERADEVEMGAGREPGAMHQRRRGQRGAGHDVGLAHGGFQVTARAHRQAGVRQLRGRGFGMGGGAAPEAHAIDRADHAVRLDQPAGGPARPDHDQVPRAGTRQPRRRVRRRAGGAARRQLLAVEQRQHPAVAPVEQRVDGRDRPLLALAVAREHGDQLDADPVADAPRRHQQQRRGRHPGNVDRVIRAQRRRDVRLQRRVQRRKHSRPGQAGADGGSVEMAHGSGGRRVRSRACGGIGNARRIEYNRRNRRQEPARKRYPDVVKAAQNAQGEQVMSDRIWLKSYPAGMPAEIDPDQFRSIPDLLEKTLAKFAARPAFHNLGHTISYAALERQSRDFAAFLQGLPGMAKGERVAIMAPNLLQYPVALFGILRAGMTVVNVNPMYTPRELEHQLKDSGARAIVILENFAGTLQQVLKGTPVEHVITTQVGDLLPGHRRLLVNFVIKKVKKMVPAWRIDGAVKFRAALARGRAGAVQARRRGERRPRVPAVHRRHHRRRQGRDAHPPQHARQPRADGHLDLGQLQGRRRDHHRAAADVPHLLPHLDAVVHEVGQPLRARSPTRATCRRWSRSSASGSGA